MPLFLFQMPNEKVVSTVIHGLACFFSIPFYGILYMKIKLLHIVLWKN